MLESEKIKKVYIVKNLAPWMMDELIAFSEISSFDIIFLREQKDFYKKELEKLNSLNVNLFVMPFRYNFLFRKLYIVIKFVFFNLGNFDFKYSGVIGTKSILWFLKLDVTKFSKYSNIHAQYATQSAVVAMLIKQFYGNQPEYSFTFHAHDIFFKNKWFSSLVKNSYKSISISDYNIKYVEKKYVGSDKIVLSRLGVFRKLIQPKELHSKESEFTIGLMSWFVEKKGIIYLLEAMKSLKNKNFNNIKLKLAGDGPLREKILLFIDQNELTEMVEYVGIVKAEDKETFYNSLDVFILPSIDLKTDMDGIPVVLMEAIAYSLPVISTNLSGIPEICINDYNGYLISEKDTTAIVDAIIDLSKNNDKRMQFSENSSLLSNSYDIEINSLNKAKILNWI